MARIDGFSAAQHGVHRMCDRSRARSEDRKPSGRRDRPTGMNHRLLVSTLAILSLVSASGETARGSGGPDPTSPGGAGSPVYIDSTEIRYLESFPVQALLVVRGSLPTPCHEAVWEVQDLGEAIDVRLWSLADPAQFCIQVLEPFEISIPLGSFESASIPVSLDGELVGRLEIGAEPVSNDASLVGAGWSFGMCAGTCIAELAVDGDVLVLTGRSHMLEEPLFVNQGTLTAEAQRRIDAAVQKLDGVSLDPVYGCPDCADGGAAYLTLAQEGATVRHEMEFGRPPEVLAELNELAIAMIDALETCGSSELVDVADECEPWQGR